MSHTYIPKYPLNDSDVNGNTMAWIADKETKCGCGGCGCKDEDELSQEALEDKFDQAENLLDDR